ncbi:MAG: hypothetical protein ACRDJU_04520 [Actinomycetota bacterium]
MAAVRSDELHSLAAPSPDTEKVALAPAPSELPPGFEPVEIPELRSYREAHPLRWGLDRVFYGIAARLWEAPMYVALDPDSRPLADELDDVMAVGALESAMPQRYRLIVPLMRWGGLRWEELAGLRRRSCRPGRISVIADGDVCGSTEVEPRSLRYQASYRLDFALAEDLADHLRDFVAPGRNARVFTHDDGAGLSQPRFIEEVWTPALERAGLDVELDPVDLTVCWDRDDALA